MSSEVSISPQAGVTISIRETPRGYLVQRDVGGIPNPASRGRVLGSAVSASVLAQVWAREVGASPEDLATLRDFGEARAQ